MIGLLLMSVSFAVASLGVWLLTEAWHKAQLTRIQRVQHNLSMQQLGHTK